MAVITMVVFRETDDDVWSTVRVRDRHVAAVIETQAETRSSFGCGNYLTDVARVILSSGKEFLVDDTGRNTAERLGFRV